MIHVMNNIERPLDCFSGADRLLVLSQRLMDWYQQPITDEDLARELGDELVPVFRYAQSRLDGKVRRVTLEPAFCHSADTAFRAIGLGYPKSVQAACLLHDIVEDTSRSLQDVQPELDKLGDHFDSLVVESVRLLTNRHQLIFKDLSKKVRADIPFDERAKMCYRAALEVLRWELPSAVSEQFAQEFEQLAHFLEHDANILSGAHIVSRDKKFTVATHLERQVYNLYLEDLVRKAAAEVCEQRLGPARSAVAIKLIDITDNIRTSEVSNRLALFKLTTKAEALLDQIQRELIDVVREETLIETTIPSLRRLVQIRLVDQLEVRRRALVENFSETRFGGLVTFLSEQAARLAEKYEVRNGAVQELGPIEDWIRQVNARAAW